MQGAVSSACFFPEDTLGSVQLLQGLGVERIELFLNTFRELSPSFAETMGQLLRSNGTKVCALHPFSSGFEPFFFFSRYEGRMEDGMELYKRYFELCQLWQVPRLVFHGDYGGSTFPTERYCEHFAALSCTAAQYGVQLCQENVARCRSGSPAFIREMRRLLGKDAAFVLDLKQARRSGACLEEFLDAMGPCLAHLHISGADAKSDCTAPAPDTLDIPQLLGMLKKTGYDGDLVIELYRDGFSNPAQLQRSYRYINGFLP